MQVKSKLAMSIVMVLLAIMLFPPSAHAYIDPATGSYVLQIVIAGIAAGAFALKMFWGKIKSLFSANSTPKKSDKDTGE
jgi:hypothetical protein